MVKGKHHKRMKARGKPSRAAKKAYMKNAAMPNATGMYHAFVTYGNQTNIYQQTQCGIYIRPADNLIEWPWCKVCQAGMLERRLHPRALSTRNLTKVIGNKFHLPKWPDQMGEGDFRMGEWRQTACGVLVQFGRQSRHDKVCVACSSHLQVPFKRKDKIVEAMLKKASKSKRRKVERIPEVVFAPTAETLTLIQGESDGISA